jgi:hypothetical protein
MHRDGATIQLYGWAYTVKEYGTFVRRKRLSLDHSKHHFYLTAPLMLELWQARNPKGTAHTIPAALGSERLCGSLIVNV